ncbi:MAG: hypothetical protein JXR23_07135 [Pontiellaceae bacterium]|nr:hypothetical protein [Pontiellaceae bacterium]
MFTKHTTAVNCRILIKPPLYICAAALLLGGCKTTTEGYKDKVEERFKNKEVANISYFADSTITMMGNLDLTVSKEGAQRIRRFIDMDSPAVQEVVKWNDSLKQDLHDMVAYSVELVNMTSEENITQPELIDRYADYLANYRTRVEKSQSMSPSAFDRTLEAVREQETFLEALRAAQPIFNAAAMESALKVEQLTEVIDSLSAEIDAAIDVEFAGIARAKATLQREKSAVMDALALLYAAYRGEPQAWKSLQQSDAILNPNLVTKESPARADLEAVREYLIARLDELDAVEENIRPNWEDYLATHEELATFSDDAVLRVQEVRIVGLTWLQAHHKMASGVTDPADWFDVRDLTITLIKSTPKLLL